MVERAIVGGVNGPADKRRLANEHQYVSLNSNGAHFSAWEAISGIGGSAGIYIFRRDLRSRERFRMPTRTRVMTAEGPAFEHGGGMNTRGPGLQRSLSYKLPVKRVRHRMSLFCHSS